MQDRIEIRISAAGGTYRHGIAIDHGDAEIIMEELEAIVARNDEDNAKGGLAQDRVDTTNKIRSILGAISTVDAYNLRKIEESAKIDWNLCGCGNRAPAGICATCKDGLEASGALPEQQ